MFKFPDSKKGELKQQPESTNQNQKDEAGKTEK